MAEAKKIFVIDDDMGLRTAYTASLSKLGYDVESAIDGSEVDKLLAHATPDLILLDMLMPNMDGMSFLKEFRTDEKYKDVKVVVASNFESTPEANDLNVTKYLSKIENEPEQIAAIIHQIMGGTTEPSRV